MSYSKYGNKKVKEDGHRFDSLAEHRRYRELKLLVHAGEIEELGLQVRFDITLNGVPICAYLADFRYFDRTLQRWIYEDVKGVKTAVYRLKKKLVEAQYGIDVQEIEA